MQATCKMKSSAKIGINLEPISRLRCIWIETGDAVPPLACKWTTGELICDLFLGHISKVSGSTSRDAILERSSNLNIRVPAEFRYSDASLTRCWGDNPRIRGTLLEKWTSSPDDHLRPLGNALATTNASEAYE
jgi:hypothetical protein